MLSDPHQKNATVEQAYPSEILSTTVYKQNFVEFL